MWLLLLLAACPGSKLQSCERAFFRDVDGDGWGTEADVALACEAPEGYVADGTDCDDTDATVNPGAAEVCDGADNDCDGGADDDDEAGAEDGATWYRDRDGDGFGDGDALLVACELPRDGSSFDGDCDDDDATVNPGQLEACNGRDDDCDTLVDEDDPSLAIGPTWYPDADADGYGAGEGELSCDPVEGAVEAGGDCDDSDPARNPGAAEVCDEVDNDCDDKVDDADDDRVGAYTWYVDHDGDGHGYRGDDETACVAPEGSVPLGDDCDDTDPERHPGAEEICGDGVDQDCDGADLPCP